MLEFSLQALLQEILLGLALVAVLWFLRKMGISFREVRNTIHEVKQIQHEIKQSVNSNQNSQ